MDDDLVQRLLYAESDFLSALKGGTQMLSSYNQTWAALPDFLHTASKAGSVGSETLSLAHCVASRIAHLASCFLDIRREEESSTTSFQRDWDTMIHQMATLDLNANSNSKSLQPGDKCGAQPSCSSTPIPTADSTSSPPFIAAAHRWFLDNIHNPYPPAEVKTRIAVTSSCQVSSVNSWFANARRRIGWTTLCRERFSNCRADTIDAAYRALVEEDPQRVLSPELIHSFVAMKVAAEGLYSSSFSRSVFTGDLDAIIKDMGEKDRGSVKVGKRRRVGLAHRTEVDQDSYPSPDRSITGTPVPSPNHSLAEGSEEEVAVSPILAGTKRRCPSAEPVDQLSSVRRPVKRLRDSMTRQAYLPSPPSSTDDVEPSSDGGSPELSPAYAIQSEKNVVTSSRKRRLSDAEDTDNMPKRPCGSIAALDTVSDPLPRFDTEDERSFDDWFNANSDALFNIPPPVDATEPDSSSSWEVELFKGYNIPPADTHIASDFDNLLQSIGGDTFVAPSGGVPLSDVAGAPYTASLDSSVPDFSQTDIDWSSFFNDPDVYQSTVYPTFPQFSADSQTPLPEIDLPMLQLPPVAPAVNSQGDTASKQAKLDQLHAMQEAVRRMEQELQSEGIL